MKRKSSKKLIAILTGFCLIFALTACKGGNESTSSSNSSSSSPAQQETEIVYETVTVKSLYEELDSNILRAEHKYLNAYVEIPGKLYKIDSEGTYFTIVDSSHNSLLSWFPDYVYCVIIDDSYLDAFFEKSIGDEITVRGVIGSVGKEDGYILALTEIVESETNNEQL